MFFSNMNCLNKTLLSNIEYEDFLVATNTSQMHVQLDALTITIYMFISLLVLCYPIEVMSLLTKKVSNYVNYAVSLWYFFGWNVIYVLPIKCFLSIYLDLNFDNLIYLNFIDMLPNKLYLNAFTCRYLTITFSVTLNYTYYIDSCRVIHWAANTSMNHDHIEPRNVTTISMVTHLHLNTAFDTLGYIILVLAYFVVYNPLWVIHMTIWLRCVSFNSVIFSITINLLYNR